jgi:release factor glutamine methyltransferase
MVRRRTGGLPLEHVLGWAEFCGLRVGVEAGVFVPRRRTEFLVRQAALLVQPGSVVVDLCCGSGAVGLALASGTDALTLYATDIDPVAVRCARRNIGERGQVFMGDLFSALPAALAGRVDVIVANTPHVPTGMIELLPRESRLYEPSTSLDGGADGLSVQRRVATDAPHWLASGGRLLVETSERQAPLVADIFRQCHLIARTARHDDLDATVVIGTKPAV